MITRSHTTSEDPQRARLAGATAARLRFRHLVLLQTLARTHSVRRAADATNITQPGASRMLREIEDIFGCQLFERTRRGLLPTAQGTVLLRGARLLLAELDQVVADVSAVADPLQVSLRIGAPPFLSMTLLPELVRALEAAAPGRVRLQLREDIGPVLFDLLRAGDLDALITRFPPRGQFGEPGNAWFAFDRLYDEELQVGMPLNHRLAKATHVRVQDLVDDRWILGAPTAHTRQTLEEQFRLKGLPPPVPVVESSAIATVQQLVASGLGIGLWPRPVGGLTRSPPGVALLSFKPRLLSAPVGLIYRRAAVDEPGIALLRGVLKAVRP